MITLQMKSMCLIYYLAFYINNCNNLEEEKLVIYNYILHITDFSPFLLFLFHITLFNVGLLYVF